MFMKSFGMPALAVLAIAAATPSVAQTVDQERRFITIDRADLNTAEGRARIDARIVRAARQVCGLNNRPSLLSGRDMFVCRASAVADAHRQLDQHIAAAQGNTEIAVVTSASSPR